MTKSAPGLLTLSMLFCQPELLPTLPFFVHQFADEISDPEATTDLLVWVFATDPELLTNFQALCMAHGIEPADRGVSWTRPIISLLGANAVRRFTIAYLMQRTLSAEVANCSFDPAESISRSRRFGLLSECAFSSPESLCSADEPEPGTFFTCELMHEMPRALLAQQAPAVYNRVQIYAETREVAFEQAFQELFDCTLGELGCCACEAWDLGSAVGDFLIPGDEAMLAAA